MKKEKEKSQDQGYKRLKIYQKAHELGVKIHKIALKLPRYEMFEERRPDKSAFNELMLFLA